MKEETFEKIRQSVDGIEYEIAAFSYGICSLNKGKRIRLKGCDTEETFFKLFERFTEAFGEPSYVHSYYGFIWRANGEYFAFGVIEEGCHNEQAEVFLFDKMPCGDRLTYAQYKEIDETVKRVFDEHGLVCGRSIHYIDKKFMYIAENGAAQCLLILKPKQMEFYDMEKIPAENGMQKIMPRYMRKQKIGFRDLSRLKNALEQCFVEEKAA